MNSKALTATIIAALITVLVGVGWYMVLISVFSVTNVGEVVVHGFGSLLLTIGTYLVFALIWLALRAVYEWFESVFRG